MSSAGNRRWLAALTLGAVALLATGCAASAAQQPPAVVTAAGQQSSSGSAQPTVAQSTVIQPTVTQASVAPTSSVPPSSLPPSPPPVRPEIPSSPELFPQADGTLQALPGPPTLEPLHAVDGQTRDGEPYRPLIFTATNVWLTPTGGGTEFDVALDAGSAIGSATQVRVSYDLTGDGSVDRVETYKYFATDPEPGTERYTQDEGLLTSTGAFGELVGGTVQLEVWSALGDGGTTVDLGDSSLTLPYTSG